LIPAAGLGAFALITPVTALLLVLLGVVCLCYRQVVKAYPVSGGSYVVSRENFGYTTAQIPGAALLCSYTLTVAVSIAAGVDAVISAFPALRFYPVELSVLFVLLLSFGNLRGIKEAGRFFAVPTYWFLASMAVVIVVGVARVAVAGHLAHLPVQAGHVPIGWGGTGLLLGASAFIFLRGFANGGSAMTGMEAISNAVTVFREPQVRNARTTLVLMASILGAMFLAVSAFAALTHALPSASGTPTVLSQIGRDIFGGGLSGAIPYYSLQFSTAVILILGANTSFNGFPLLVSFIAQDAYLPRPLTTRGHRLVYSNGVIVLAVLSVALLVATRAQVSSLIPLYACTV
ncbi:MAG: APC family permease, partial [Candidatus Dormibacteria bacterium]